VTRDLSGYALTGACSGRNDQFPLIRIAITLAAYEAIRASSGDPIPDVRRTGLCLA
jgi:hypothetical protein